MTTENALMKKEEMIDEEFSDSVDLDELEAELQGQLEQEFEGLEFLKEEKEKIGNPDELGKVVMDVIWEQFINQIGVQAGEDFIKDNNGNHLDLSKDAHFQTTENFAKGKIATHNTEIDYQKRYDEWQANFKKDEQGKVVTHVNKSGREVATVTKDARKPFDKNRPRGSAEKHTDMDHTISAAEIIRDPAANAHMTKEEQVNFANSEANLNEIDSSLNRMKGDQSVEEMLADPNSKLTSSQKKELKKMAKKGKKAREEYDKSKNEGEKKSIEAGKKSQKQEALRIGGKVLRTAAIQLLSELVKEIVSKLVKWFKNSKKEFKTLLDSVKEAIRSFICKMKTHMINIANGALTTIATAIIGPVVGTIKKVWMLMKQGWNSLKQAVNYIKDPANKGKPLSLVMMEVGKIVIAGLTAIGALTLGEVIEKGLMTFPFLNVEIPLLGPLTGILGMFFGAVVSGISGAIFINFIDKIIAKKQKAVTQASIIDKGNKIMVIQAQQKIIAEVKLDSTKESVRSSIANRHEEAGKRMHETLANIMEDFVEISTKEENVILMDENDMKITSQLAVIDDDLKHLISGL